MKIYFTAAISLSDLFGKSYKKIADTINSLGHQIMHEHITEHSLKGIFEKTREENLDYYKKTLKVIGKADLVVAEVSFPSTLNVGHEVSLALEKGKPVLALYQKDKISPFFEGISSDNFYYRQYDPEKIEEMLPNLLNEVIKNTDTRFNFFISPEIGRYLDWIHREQKTPRAVFLRTLLEKAMRGDKEFEKK